MKRTKLEQQFIFIVGAPRSGTTWLHRMIAEHPEVASIPHELTVFSGYLSTWFRNYAQEKKNIDAGRWEQGMPLVLKRDELLRHARALSDSVYSKVLEQNPNATHVLDKHPNYANYMDLIKELVPNARFIHILRDGRQVALSMMSVNKRVGHSAGDIRQAARDWHKFVSSAQNSGERLGSDFMEVRYEHLLEQGSDKLKGIFEFCGLSTSDDLLKNIQDKFDPSKGKLSSGDPNSGVSHNDWEKRMRLSERYIFNKMAGGLLIRTGYAHNGWWAYNMADRLKMTLAAPAVRIKRTLRALVDQMKQPIESDLDHGK